MVRFPIIVRIQTEDLIANIKIQNELISDVSLKDLYKDTRTIHIVYQNPQGNLTNEEITKIRSKIISSLRSTFKALVK